MAEEILNQFDYYYGLQSETFSFIRTPKILLKDIRFSGLRAESVLLYGILLDRQSLSQANQWFDEENRVYIIFPLKEIMEELNYGHSKCTSLLQELESYGLIERKKRGLGKPDIIYVKNFIYKEESASKPCEYTECSNSALKNAENQHSGMTVSSSQECSESASNKTDINNTKINKTDMINTDPLPLLHKVEDSSCEPIEEDEEEKIKKQIDYARLKRKHQGNLKLLAFILQQMTEMMTETSKKIELSSNQFENSEEVKKRLRQITYDDIEDLLHMLPDKEDSKIKNPKGYLRRCLFNLVDRRGAICATSQIKGNKYGCEYNFDDVG